MIKVVTNNLGSGNWITIADDQGDLWGGHRITAHDLYEILKMLKVEVDLVEVDDTQLDEGMY